MFSGAITWPVCTEEDKEIGSSDVVLNLPPVSVANTLSMQSDRVVIHPRTGTSKQNTHTSSCPQFRQDGRLSVSCTLEAPVRTDKCSCFPHCCTVWQKELPATDLPRMNGICDIVCPIGLRSGPLFLPPHAEDAPVCPEILCQNKGCVCNMCVSVCVRACMCACVSFVALRRSQSVLCCTR